MPEENSAAPAPAPASAPAPVQSAPVSSGSGKSSNKVIIIIVIVVVVLGIVGYAVQRYFAKKIAEKSVESILSNATGGKVSVDSSDNGGVSINSNGSTLSTGSKSTWPSTMPSSVPEFKYGTISSSSTSNEASYKAWNASFSGISSDALTKYSAELVAKGWSQTYSADADTVSNRMYDTASYSLNFSVESADKTAIILVTAK